MNFIKAFTITALATATLVGVAPKAEASQGCYRALAADDIAMMMRGGATAGEAIDYAIDNGNIDSKRCLTSVVGYMRSMPYVFGDVLN